LALEHGFNENPERSDGAAKLQPENLDLPVAKTATGVLTHDPLKTTSLLGSLDLVFSTIIPSNR
jgi:hypothetical protein